jgi:hypothetical protein
MYHSFLSPMRSYSGVWKVTQMDRSTPSPHEILRKKLRRSSIRLPPQSPQLLGRVAVQLPVKCLESEAKHPEVGVYCVALAKDSRIWNARVIVLWVTTYATEHTHSSTIDYANCLLGALDSGIESIAQPGETATVCEHEASLH